MLSLKYVMAKSKELTSKLELGAVVGGARVDAPSSASSVAGSDAAAARSLAESDLGTGHGHEGEAFLVEQHKDWDAVLARHRKLLQSGDEMSDELGRARKRLQDQVESQAYVEQHFHEIKRVREQISAIRGLVEKIAVDVEEVEQALTKQTEEYMAAQNAQFVVRQEQELDLFEERILEEKEGRKKQLLAARRQVLAEAFQNDLKTYQTLVAYQGPVLTQRAISPPQEESLESVDLVVTTDEAQLEAFYDTEDDDEAAALHFEEEEEKTEDKEESPSEPLGAKASTDEDIPENASEKPAVPEQNGSPATESSVAEAALKRDDEKGE